MNKTQIHSSYMNEWKKKAEKLTEASERLILITGDLKQTSIGEKIRQQIQQSHNAKFLSFSGDVRDQKCIADYFAAAADLGFATDLIICHGVTHLDWFESQTEKLIKEQVDVNLTGTAILCNEFVRNTIDNSYRKRIIVIGSMAYKAVLNGSAAYCASKAGVNMLVKCLAWELAPKGYDIFIINPSNTVNTPMTQDTIAGLMRYRNLSREAAEQYWGAILPKQDWLNSQNIADLVEFLISGKGDYLSGSSIDLPGGQR